MSQEKSFKTVKALIRNEEGNFLVLQKSSEYDQMGERWEQPGGKIRNDEDRFEAAEREIKQETGLEAGDFEDLVRIELEDSEKTLEVFLVLVESFKGEIGLSEEHQDFRWIDKEEALDLEWHRDASYVLPVIEYLDEYRSSSTNYGEGERIDVAKVLVRNQEGKFLAVQKTDEDKIHSGDNYSLYGRMSGKWELPGGKIEQGDDRFEAAKTEVEEETGLRINQLQDVVREETEEVNAVNAYILFTESFSGDIELSGEHQDFKWVSPEDYKQLNWHQDAGYGYPPMKYLSSYLKSQKS